VEQLAVRLRDSEAAPPLGVSVERTNQLLRNREPPEPRFLLRAAWEAKRFAASTSASTEPLGLLHPWCLLETVVAAEPQKKGTKGRRR
jgi:hypothetical protein